MDHYRIEVHETKGERGNCLDRQIMEEYYVMNMNKAECDLRKAFGYNYHKSTEKGWFWCESRKKVESKCKKVLEHLKNSE